ncbi:DinB family protein [Paenibacillus cellulosilyticus]|uniref:DinB family protein n=1 Tax=Paenibacillus cellulosilyticus TaxID=375489 RepID=A0A2V2YXH6_9BACL|nr:DinB family protein [Paenibacillus cellulosilyticus]QKS47486.1 DinB family protein [Paenibacillus cellulosilyticus]
MSEVNIQAYLDTHLQLTQAIAGLSEEELKWKQTEAKWSVTEVLAHLTDHNIVVSFRLRDILADTQARLPAFDQDRWVAGQHSNDGNVEDILAVFWSLVQYNGLLFARLSEQDWDKAGVNFKGETVRVRDIVRGFTNHVQHHLAQIERIRTAYRNREAAAAASSDETEASVGSSCSVAPPASAGSSCSIAPASAQGGNV